MSDNSISTTSGPGYTRQGQLVAAHWSRLAVTYEAAIASLRSKGIEPEKATAEDLHSLDMLHMGGLAATDSLSEMAGIAPGQKVLDVGSGVGGPARRMASKYGALAWGIDLSEQLCETAMRFTELVGLRDRVQFKQGSALALPFGDGEFDVVVMQHMAMQIAEKDLLFAECARVINSNGCLAMHEIFAGEAGQPHYPFAWATEPEMSSLESLEACLARLKRLEFEVGQFMDLSEEGRRYHERNINTYQAALAQQQGAQGLSVEASKVRLRTSQSMEMNLREGRLKVGMLVGRKK